jgi:GNAT superfamily N-acetyltransferase
MASIRRLEATDDVSGFRSGNDDLDRYLHRYAQVNQIRFGIGVTYLAYESSEIAGYATVSASEGKAVDFDALRGKKLPRYPIPMLRLARLAVAAAWQRKGIGNQLLRHALGLALRMEAELGCVGVLVDAKPQAVKYYHQFGFEPKPALEGQVVAPEALLTMFLPMETIRGSIKR